MTGIVIAVKLIGLPVFCEFLVRQPAARSLGKRRGEGLAVVLVEGIGMGHKGVEITGRALVVKKR